MGRNRTPTAVLELRGAFKNHPSRRREREGEIKPSTPLGSPPTSFTRAQKAIWSEVKERGTWLVGPDRYMTEIAVVLMDKHRRNAIDYKEIPHLLAVLSKLGFTPVDRVKMRIDAETEDGDLSAFI